MNNPQNGELSDGSESIPNVDELMNFRQNNNCNNLKNITKYQQKLLRNINPAQQDIQKIIQV